MKNVIEMINRRVDGYGVKGATVERKGADLVVVQLPKLEDTEAAIGLIGFTAVLEFKERTCLKTGSTVLPNGQVGDLCNLPENHVDKEMGLTGSDLARTYPGTNSQTGKPVVNVQFNSRGARIFGDMSTRLVNTPNRLVIFLDDVEIVAPVFNDVILGGSAIIEGPDFTPERVRTICIQLNAAYPIPIRLVSRRSLA
ncbi:MAG: hypothetical protein V1724_08590 [Chloroflexota bacterium]